MKLKHESDRPIAELGERRVAPREEILPVDHHLSPGGTVERSEDVEQGGFSRPRWTDDRHALAGRHLEVDVPITIVEAARGGTVEVPTLGGTKKIRVPAGTQDGAVQRLRGEGPPRLSGSGRGDIHYRLKVQIPKSLTKEQQDAVEQLSKVMNGNPRAELLDRARKEA